MSVVLGLETSTFFPPCPEEYKERLVTSYRQNHFVLRGIRKFYHSRLVHKNNVYTPCLQSYNELDLEQKIPLTPQLRNELIKHSFPATAEPFLKYPPLEVAWILEHPIDRNQFFWPAQILEDNYFLERSKIQILTLDSPGEHSHIRDKVTCVAEELDLRQKLNQYAKAPSITKPQQQKIEESISQKYEDREVQETTTSMATATLETSPGIQEHETSEQGSSRYHEARSPFTGSLSMAHGLGVGPVLPAPLEISALFWFGYLGFKIYEFFVPQKETSTNLKDCLFKCGEQKISKETTFEPTLIKLELNSNDKPRNCTEKLY